MTQTTKRLYLSSDHEIFWKHIFFLFNCFLYQDVLVFAVAIVYFLHVSIFSHVFNNLYVVFTVAYRNITIL